ncbi:hypothetical protein MXD62_19380 [Frankia sp. Mgl5]|uniref:hypothetical protein n=1 Tax=Frankia sp. Mgl5 TaxID=2933793 RepID=UPI00200C2DB8|nr:hypothetical protein [Frankia sp. Mgl5]MCK9929314.1 hypothetical protein [Frankia sp. Mgl5]
MRRWSTGRLGALRDWVLFAAGLAGVAHETLLRDVDRPALLLLYAAMLGLPYALGADRPAEPPPPSPPLPPSSGGADPSSSPTSSASPS